VEGKGVGKVKSEPGLKGKKKKKKVVPGREKVNAETFPRQEEKEEAIGQPNEKRGCRGGCQKNAVRVEEKKI